MTCFRIESRQIPCIWVTVRIPISDIEQIHKLVTIFNGVIRYLPLNNAAFKILSILAQEKHHKIFVFADKNGKLPDTPHLSTRHFKKAIKRAAVPEIRFHDLRTTYASNFVMAGGDIFALSKLLGHTKVEMTAQRYAALHPRFMKEIVQTIQFEV